jgi:hypothetical protein
MVALIENSKLSEMLIGMFGSSKVFKKLKSGLIDQILSAPASEFASKPLITINLTQMWGMRSP